MHNLRKLLVLAVNQLLERRLISLDGENEQGHLLTTIAGEPSVVNWRGIGSQELQISVWWKYDHSKHPQADLQGSYRETFTGTAPLAKSQHYPKFVGAFASAWLERSTAKHLQGRGAKHIFKHYVRRGESENLDAIPTPVPNGFDAEGKFFS
ncbi:MAG: hypothetical protein ACT6Q9_05810 [Polaromonas sp.]|uniref:hypothetical protein n=1 Tax=Polaromonas sp. TaxID=1869339 RepID=UPI004036092B